MLGGGTLSTSDRRIYRYIFRRNKMRVCEFDVASSIFGAGAPSFGGGGSNWGGTAGATNSVAVSTSSNKGMSGSEMALTSGLLGIAGVGVATVSAPIGAVVGIGSLAFGAFSYALDKAESMTSTSSTVSGMSSSDRAALHSDAGYGSTSVGGGGGGGAATGGHGGDASGGGDRGTRGGW